MQINQEQDEEVTTAHAGFLAFFEPRFPNQILRSQKAQRLEQSKQIEEKTRITPDNHRKVQKGEEIHRETEREQIMPQYFLRPNHFNSEVIQKSRPAIDKDVYYVDDPRDQVNHIICGAKQVFSNCDAKRNDNHRVQGYKDDENLPSTPLLAMLNDRYFPLFIVIIA